MLKHCLNCNKQFEVENYRRNSAHFCSRKCNLEVLSKKLSKTFFGKCLVCGKPTKNIPSRTRKYCSVKCRGKIWSNILKSNSNRTKHLIHFKKGHIPWSKGKSCPQLAGENNPCWKGEKVGYFALHTYIAKHLGKPKKCSICGTQDPHKRYHWANKSGEYKRDFSDWIRLCVKCHSEYDNPQ